MKFLPTGKNTYWKNNGKMEKGVLCASDLKENWFRRISKINNIIYIKCVITSKVVNKIYLYRKKKSIKSN